MNLITFTDSQSVSTGRDVRDHLAHSRLAERDAEGSGVSKVKQLVGARLA
jgi:hypothetical protein